ncbi:TNF receptor-associated factor 5 [Athalia rosae]|uniref:TNF receptor-associated factor 5 n=1 Tax=Athalia rosae TaxID=37344 RepID=UPI002033AACE|nr:TNF receptor-associated factor 5 [Athalia rosae]
MSNNMNHVARRSAPCYFCSEFIEERYIMEHIKHCGAVLEECPEKCGAYIPRFNLKSHHAQCSSTRIKTISHTNATEVPKSIDETWKERVMSVLNLMRTAILDGKREQKKLEEKLTLSLETIRSKETALEAVKNKLTEANNRTRLSDGEVDFRLNRVEQAFTHIDEQLSLNFKQTYDQLELLENKFKDEEIIRKSNTDEWRKEIDALKKFLAQENAMISSVWHEQLKQIHDLKLELEMRCKASKELVKTQDILSEKIDILVQELRKHSEAIKSQADDTKALKFQLKENVTYLEDTIKEIPVQNIPDSVNCRCLNQECFEPISTSGRLLWRIDRYKEKMTDAKENDTVLRSPIFYNKEYGYTLGVELFLNGRGQWKERHVIGCLQVLDGKWDALLDWPCILQATIILRDQENPANNVKKMLKVKRKDAADDNDKINKESGMYIFIPHTKLTRHDGFTKNNVVFLDIQVKDVKIGGSMASLIS